MKKIFLLSVLILLMTVPFSIAQDLEIQGHRGARGLLPENSLPGFIKAVDLGVNTLEMDVVISADRKVVVSHEAWINPSICLDPNGEKIPKEQSRKLNIYKMTYEEVKSYNCGALGNPRFPGQQALDTHKPLLKEVITTVEQHRPDGGRVRYNIEIKSGSKSDKLYHPEVPDFSMLVYGVIDSLLPWDRVTIQSFDLRVLEYWNSNHPTVNLAFLVENTKSVRDNLDELNFKPAIYSPYFRLLKREDIVELHALGIRVIPWTVNEKKDMEQLIQWGVDGLITDYPDKALELKAVNKN